MLTADPRGALIVAFRGQRFDLAWRWTGIAFAWIGSTTAFGVVVRSRKRCAAPELASTWSPRSPLNSVHMPAKQVSGRSSLIANHTTSFFLVSGVGSGAYSAKLLNGTRQRFSGFSQPRQCVEDVLRILVTGGPPARGGGGMPQRIRMSSRSAPALRTTGADNPETRRASAEGCSVPKRFSNRSLQSEFKAVQRLVSWRSGKRSRLFRLST
jgi:hypothetical protein